MSILKGKWSKMRKVTRVFAWLWTLLMLCTAAAAEAPFLRHADGWELDGVPLEATLSADVISLLPYDETRSAMLSDVIDNLSLRLVTGEDEGSVTIRVGMTDAVRMAYQGNAVQLSCVPDFYFTASDDPMGTLLGESTTGFDIYGLRGDAETLLDDGWVLLNALIPKLEDYGNRKNVKTNITDMGLARTCTDFTIPKNEAESLSEILLTLCPEGWLREMIGTLTFSGKQTLRVYQTEDGVPLRAEYNGTCGPEGNLRTVKLVWRMRRDDVAHRDEVTLTSPAKSGGNKNTLEFERLIQTGKNGELEMTGSFTYTVTADKLTTSRKGEFALVNAFTEDTDVITGSATFQQKLPGETAWTGMRFEPSLTLSGTQEAPRISGSIGYAGLSGKNVAEQVTIYLTIAPCTEEIWSLMEEYIDLDLLTEAELAALRGDVSSAITSSLVRPLIILMGDTADWFFQDMPEDAVDEIVDAANTVVITE